jgi:pimeloyl-ACP methyl ester carboxylesterase
MYRYIVEPLYVKSDKDVLAADFYHPQTKDAPAVIIMAHGLAGLRQFKLMQYAKRFAEAGYAVVLFDYRSWGGSTGRPREVVSLKHQLNDWRTMIEHVAARKSIDAKRIVLWGTALSAGYVLNLAVELPHIRAVMAQVPFVDGAETAKLYPLQQLPKALKLSSQDYMGSKVGLEPKRLPVVHPEKFSFLTGCDNYQGYLSIVQPDYYWSGEIPARALLQLIRYRPITLVEKIRCPVLFIAAKQDTLAPIESSRACATNIAPYVQYHEWDIQHFDIYQNEYLEKAIQTQIAFLHQYIGASQ